MGDVFHQRGRHVQRSHAAASKMDGGEHEGAMIALIPSQADVDRLTIRGGEPADQLHLTLYFLGNAADWSPAQRETLTDAIRQAIENNDLRAVPARAFGANFWNPGGDEPCWVLGVGDAAPGSGALVTTQLTIGTAAAFVPDIPPIPAQHSPWSPHVALAYTKDTSLIGEVVKRVGSVTFEWVRIAFGNEYTEIELSPADESVTAAAPHVDHMTGTSRPPTPTEVASRIDFAKRDRDWRTAVDYLVSHWSRIKADQRRELADQIKAAVDDERLDRLADLAVSSEAAAELLAERMRQLAEDAAAAVVAEAADQGVDVPPPVVPVKHINNHAAAVAALLAATLATSAGRNALRLARSGASGQRVAQDVVTDLAEAKDVFTRDQLAAAASMAQNEGRAVALAAAPAASYYASEASDARTCDPCSEVDGRSYSSLDAAQADYPSGSYVNCDGRERCRGTYVAVWSEPESLAAAGTMPDHVTQGVVMPWHTVHNHAECPDGKPWAVVKDSDGSVEGCHASEADANSQVAALYANEPDASSDADLEAAGGKPNQGTKKDKRLKDNKKKMAAGDGPPEDAEHLDGDTTSAEAVAETTSEGAWEGVLTMEGIETGDGREFAPDSLSWDDPPMPLMWQKETSHGGDHNVSVRVGSVLRVWRDGQKVMGSGVFDLGGPDDDDAHEAWRRMQAGMLTGNSVDVDSVKDADVEYVWPESDGGEAVEDQGDIISILFGMPEKIIFHKGRIRGTTLCEFPAFTEARLSLVDGGSVTVGEDNPDAVTAHAVHVDWAPSAAWFTDPGFTVPVPITITDDGRIYGHAAQWGQCHLGQSDVCVTPPHEDTHPYFLTGEVTCDDGTRVPVGQITVGTSHAPLYLGANAASDHYDNTGAAVADVTVGNDRYGIWVAGAVRPSAEAWRVRELQASGQLSGDWRRIGGKLRLVGLLAVNIPGFPVPKLAARVASGEPCAIVAAGKPTVSKGYTVKEMDRRALELVRDRIAASIGRPRVPAGSTVESVAAGNGAVE